MPRTPLEPNFLTRKEAAERACVSRWMVDRAIRSGELRAGGGPNSTRIRPEWVDAWIETRRVREAARRAAS